MSNPRPVILVIALVLAAAGCSSGSDSSRGAAATTAVASTGSTTTTSAPIPPTSTAPVTTATTTTAPPTSAAPDVGDWEQGLRYDFGGVTTMATAANGLTTIEFDRYALYTESGSTVDHWDTEPILGWHSDVPWINTNGKLRRYTVAPDARYLVASDHCNLPNGDFNTNPPTWATRPLEEFAQEVKNGYAVASLSFGPNGLVTQVRLDPAC